MEIKTGMVVPERYLDIITCEFAYDPVRLPVDQDPTQSLYDRKTLEMIWETKCEAQNPYTRQWFNAKTAIPQTVLRREMEEYIKLHHFSASDGAELDVIEEYAKVLEEGEMKQYLKILEKSLLKILTTKKQCTTMWKKINLLRMYCQFHSKNIETFRSLDGFKYLNQLILETTIPLSSPSVEMDIKEAARDTFKEIARTIDVIDLKPVDIDNIKEENKFIFTMGYISMIYLSCFSPCNKLYEI